MDIYTERFEKTHKLLKEYGCKQTYSCHPEYQCPVVLGGSFFYRLEKEMKSDCIQKDWKEEIDAGLDVVIPTSIREAEKKQIRFDIEWSQRVKLYSMYISLPTSSRSKSLSHKRFKTQDEVITEIVYWLKEARCKREVAKEQKPKIKTTMQYEQLGLF